VSVFFDSPCISEIVEQYKHRSNEDDSSQELMRFQLLSPILVDFEVVQVFMRVDESLCLYDRLTGNIQSCESRQVSSKSFSRMTLRFSTSSSLIIA
jgi:hypothetical protein